MSSGLLCAPQLVHLRRCPVARRDCKRQELRLSFSGRAAEASSRLSSGRNVLFIHGRFRRHACCRASASAFGISSESVADATAKAIQVALRVLTQAAAVLGRYPRHVQCGVAASVIGFALWGFLPVAHHVRRHFFQRRDWDRSQTKQVITAYLRPLMLWAAVAFICRTLDPVVLASERSQAIKERLVNFLRSLSTVLTFAFCTARLTQQIQKFMMERKTSDDTRNLGIQFIGNAVSTSVWVAAVCLFMELLGFSTQKWLTAGGFGTVLLTLAGREIFTNFLSSVMIHATRPFVENEWIQTKIDGQDVSGTVEHVGWWSPTVIRGEDREAVHIPNNKFTMSVVRNLTQKKHWRIKTHIGISHLDVTKINLIIADMRKVLSKQPQVEHKRLHRRVFFDSIDPVNQSLLIIVSCFVKTSHYEEYLSVKEIIMFNLLKVISHHNARLATPVRTIQRLYDEDETRNSPFRPVSREDGRPLLLLEATAASTITPSSSKPVQMQEPSADTPSIDSNTGEQAESVPSRMEAVEANKGIKTEEPQRASVHNTAEMTAPKSDGEHNAGKTSVFQTSKVRNETQTQTSKQQLHKSAKRRQEQQKLKQLAEKQQLSEPLKEELKEQVKGQHQQQQQMKGKQLQQLKEQQKQQQQVKEQQPQQVKEQHQQQAKEQQLQQVKEQQQQAEQQLQQQAEQQLQQQAEQQLQQQAEQQLQQQAEQQLQQQAEQQVQQQAEQQLQQQSEQQLQQQAEQQLQQQVQQEVQQQQQQQVKEQQQQQQVKEQQQQQQVKEQQQQQQQLEEDDPWKEPNAAATAAVGGGDRERLSNHGGMSDPERFKEVVVRGGGALDAVSVLQNDLNSAAAAASPLDLPK